MKLVILHLSDIHFKAHNSYKNENVESIIHCLRKPCADVDGILIVVSGDLTYQGFYYECQQAENFFADLRKQITEEFHFSDVNILMVPGNHDVNNKSEVLTADSLNEISRNQTFEAHLPSQRSKLKQTLKLCRTFGCFCNPLSLVDIKTITFQKGTEQCNIQFNLINTAPFSAKEDEDKGFHYLPSEDMDKLDEPSKAEYVFTVMHHPHQFYNWETQTRLEELLIKNSDAIFVGHEHYSKVINMSTDKDNVQIYSGGMLSNKGDWNNSCFYISELDTSSRDLFVTEYSWSVADKLYSSEPKGKRKLSSSKGNILNFDINKMEYSEIMMDKKYMISENILNYFVFPLIEAQPRNYKEDGREINKAEDFITELNSKKKAFIFGQPGYGKTVLARYLFDYYLQSHVVLLINGIDIRDLKFERAIKHCFEKLYSEKPIDWERFNQTRKEQKVIIVDDAHLISDSFTNEFFKYLDVHFGTIIQLAQSDIEFDIVERIKKKEETTEYEYYRLRSFYKDRREKLITNIVKILINQGEDAQQRVIEQITESLRKQRNMFSWNPDGIVQFAKFACNNIGDSLRNDGDTFSKVFEMNLSSLLTPYSGKIKVDKILFVLDKIAYALHVTPNTDKKYPMLSENIIAVVRKYNEVYDEEIEPTEFIEIVTKANILKRYGQGYIFAERSYLAYFIAREMRREAQKGNFDEFKKCLDFACYGINADIVLFITYISDNPVIITMIMDKAAEYIAKWDEFTLAPVNIPFLSDVDGIKILAPTDSDLEGAEKAAVKREQEDEKNVALMDQSKVYSYNEGDLDLVNEMIRSVSVLTILARTLPSFEHIMEAPDKKRCVELIYTLPLRIFHMWASEIEKAKDAIATDIKEMLELRNLNEFEYRKPKPVTISDAAKLLKAESILLLLELLNTAMAYATRHDTHKYIDAFDYKEKMTYMLEHLMSQDKRDNPVDFKKEAIELFEKCRSQTEVLLVQNVTRHYMVISKRLDRGGRAQLNAKIFDNKLSQPKLLMDVAKNAKRDSTFD